MKKLLSRLKSDYSDINFAEGESFYWSPKDRTVFYPLADAKSEVDDWSLLHEVSHGILDHTDYTSDFELVRLEVEAWDKARQIAKNYGLTVDPDHIEDCLDTYRDWLHRRSTCPECGLVSTQSDSHTYSCFNCKSVWQVSNSRFCRPYRRLIKQK